MRARLFAVLVLSAAVFAACDAEILSDEDSTETHAVVAVTAGLDGPAGASPVCLPVSAFGSDMDQIDACMDCVEGARCTVDQFDAGCCTLPIAPSGGTTPTPSPDPGPGPATGTGMDAIGGAAQGAFDPPTAAPPLGSRSSG